MKGNVIKRKKTNLEKTSCNPKIPQSPPRPPPPPRKKKNGNGPPLAVI